MTTKQILKLLKESGKPVVLSHLYRLFRKLDIQPLGSSRPQIYPANTAQRLLTHLGVQTIPQPMATNGTPKLVTVAQLKAAKPAKRKAAK